MKKLITYIVLALVIMSVLVPNAALAAGRNDYRGNGCRMNETQTVEVEEVKGPSEMEYRVLERMVDSANRTISRMVRLAQRTPYDDVDFLLWQVDMVVSGVMSYAGSIGATVECTYDEYVIDGRTVLIDPLRVIHLGR